MIKFRCAKCNQKMGVKDDWAGKRVRCARCQEPCVVPSPTASKPAQAISTTQYTDPPDPFGAGNLDIFSDNPVMGEGNTPAEPPLERVPVATGAGQAGGGEGVDMWGDDVFGADLQAGPSVEIQEAPPRPASTIPTVKSSGGTVPAMALAKGAGKIPLSIACSVVCTLVVAAIWAGVGTVTGFNFFYLEVLIGAAAGGGLVLLTHHRNMFLGVVAAVIGLGGMMAGKAFLAQWYLLPEIKTLARDNQKFMNEMQGDLTDKAIDEMLEEEPGVMFIIVCRHMEETDQIEKGTVQVLLQNFAFQQEDEELDEQMVEYLPKIMETMSEWDQEQARQMTRKYAPDLMQEIFQIMSDTPAGFTMAFQETFDYWDWILIPIGMAAAFGVAAKEKD
ncbi:MAG: hypothetical protein JW828_06610 [Sedimentisphaerales bacterium]|nr:hypothetical protein [Sedimentisphaerales bacterium]